MHLQNETIIFNYDDGPLKVGSNSIIQNCAFKWGGSNYGRFIFTTYFHYFIEMGTNCIITNCIFYNKQTLKESRTDKAIQSINKFKGILYIFKGAPKWIKILNNYI